MYGRDQAHSFNYYSLPQGYDGEVEEQFSN